MPSKLDPKKRQYFELGDRLSIEERKAVYDAGHMVYHTDSIPAYRVTYMNWALKKGVKVGAVYAGVKRPPKKGEWYLSGSTITAYKAPNDLNTAYHIAKIVVVEVKTVTNRKELLVL